MKLKLVPKSVFICKSVFASIGLVNKISSFKFANNFFKIPKVINKVFV